ncbi:helix-turn-helix domain-containing protein [Sphaerisporangium aureirubrum]|uniref:MerR family transcriptional regulator n=1 Tax=Sphaerisporangium aureirubrum TaxID=1544736 RepID=A0ABW1NHI3_9ACTN
MKDDSGALFTIGGLARRTGLPVRTIRFWSDIGAISPAARTARGWRLYDAGSVARLELVATLRDLGLGLDDIRRVLEKETTLAEVAAMHVEALDASIRTLRLRRAVLSTVVHRGSSTEEIAQMSELARLSAEQRKQIVDDFLDEVLSDLDPSGGIHTRLRLGTPDLPDDPTAAQVDAWVELATLVRDQDFRRAIRALATQVARARAARRETPGAPENFTRRLIRHASTARQDGIPPESPEAGEVLARILADPPPGHRDDTLLQELELAADPRAERYWHLMATVNSWPPYPSGVPSPSHLTLARDAHLWTIAALRTHRPPPADQPAGNS